MKEDTGLKNRIGKDNPFKVPEGYFEDVVPEIMRQLPEIKEQEQEELTLWERAKPWVYMAAMFCGIMFGVRVMMKDNPAPADNGVVGVSMNDTLQDIPDEYIDPILNQTTMDGYTLYMYLTDAD